GRDVSVWRYRPTQHKNQHRGKRREIAIGPVAQEILRPFLRPSTEAYLFSPAETVAEWRKGLTKDSQGARKRKSARTRLAGTYYKVTAYYTAIRRGCIRAGVPIFGPHRLRHSRATEIRQRFGLEAAQAVLGHDRVEVTQIYAEKNAALAAEI